MLSVIAKCWLPGGGGFIGSHLASALTKDNRVRVLDYFSTGQRSSLPKDVTVIEGDVRDKEIINTAMDNIDVVFHKDAMVSVPKSVKQQLSCRKLKVSAIINVLDFARQQDARVVLASSAAVYGNPATVPIEGKDSIDSGTPNETEKHLGEQYAQFHTEEYGLPTVPLRYFNVYGPAGLTENTLSCSAPSFVRPRPAIR